MTPHSPKTLALEASLDRLLSPEAEARLQRHVSACDVCQRQRELMLGYRTVSTEVAESALPELDWGRIESALETQVASQSNAAWSRHRRVLWPALAAAAALLIAVLNPGTSPDPAATESAEAPTPAAAVPTPVALEAEPARRAIQGSVSFAANRVTQGDASQPIPMAMTDRIVQGMTLRTGPGGRLHARLSGGTGFVLSASSEVHVAELREGQVRLELRGGEVLSQVQKLGEGDRYVVAAGGYEAHVRGTLFAVAQGPTGTQVSVSEGRVETLRDGRSIAVSTAGQRWASSDVSVPENKGSAGIREDKGRASAPRGLGGAEAEWPVVKLPAFADVAAWVVDGERISALGALSMRHPPGAGRIELEDKRGAKRILRFQVAAEGLSLSEQDLRRALAPEPRWGRLDQREIAPVVRAGLPGLQRCYERSLREHNEASGKLTLQLTVSMTGKVREAKADGAGLPKDLQACVRAVTRAWVFPPPSGGPVRLSLPLNLRPRR